MNQNPESRRGIVRRSAVALTAAASLALGACASDGQPSARDKAKTEQAEAVKAQAKLAEAQATFDKEQGEAQAAVAAAETELRADETIKNQKCGNAALKAAQADPAYKAAENLPGTAEDETNTKLVADTPAALEEMRVFTEVCVKKEFTEAELNGYTIMFPAEFSLPNQSPNPTTTAPTPEAG